MPSSSTASEQLRILIRERGGRRRALLVLSDGLLSREEGVDERDILRADVVIEVSRWGADPWDALRCGSVRVVAGSSALVRHAKVLKEAAGRRLRG